MGHASGRHSEESRRNARGLRPSEVTTSGASREAAKGQAAAVEAEGKVKKADVDGFAGGAANAAMIDSLRGQISTLRGNLDASAKQLADCKSGTRR